MRPASFFQFQLVDTTDDFGTVCRPQPLHNVPNVNFDGALAHIQFVCDNLVGVAELETLKNCRLTGSELLSRNRPSGRALTVYRSCTQNARGHECSTSFHKMNDFHREL